MASDDGGESPCFAHLLDELPDARPQAPMLSDDVLADLLRQLTDAVVVADTDGKITFWNDAATRLFGWSAGEVLGRSLDLIIPERLRARHWAGYRRTMATGHTSYGDRLLEVPALHRDGRVLSIAFTVTLLRDHDGRGSAIAAVLRDDTERWQERRRLQAELAALRDAPPGAGASTVDRVPLSDEQPAHTLADEASLPASVARTISDRVRSRAESRSGG